MGVVLEILIYILKGIVQLLMWTWWIIVPIVGVLAYQNLRKSKWVSKQETIVLNVKIPKNSEKGPIAAEMMFASLHSILKPASELKKEGSLQEHISFEIVADSRSISFYVWVPKHLRSFVEGQIYAQYPTAEIYEVEDYTKDIDIDDDGNDDHIAGCELKLVKPDYYPIKTFQNFEVDPLAGITGALSKIEDVNEKMWIQILTRPATDQWRNKGLAYADSLKGGTPNLFSSQGIKGAIFAIPKTIIAGAFDFIFPPDSKSSGGSTDKVPHSVEVSLAGLEEKSNKLGFQVKVRILYVAKTKEIAKQHLRITAGAFKQFNTTAWNGFAFTKTRTGNDALNEYRARLFADKGYVLNIEEIASLYHLPHISVETPNITWTSSKKGEPPANLPYADDPAIDQNDLTIFGETTYRGQLKKFGIKKDDRRRHMYVLGKSGVGKSKILEILAVEDIKRGEGVGIVDPHGELIHDVLKQIPENRIEDVVYINPADKDHPVGFNPMKATPELREGVASGFVSVFKKQFGYSWGPRLEYLMRYAILALTYYPDTTMLDVVKILTDKDFRKKVLTYVEDPVVKTFWLKEFSTYNDKFATEAVAPILNKVGQFTASPTIRNIIGQTKETFDFEDAMNSQKIILVDLSSGKIGEDNSELLGSLMITKMQLAAMARARINPEDRKDFFLYVDEFQNFATDSFAKILSEARKYRLSLGLANQYVAQMEETVRDAVFGNVGTLISFRVGATDASYLEKEFSPTFEKDDLVGLDNQHMYLNMLIDGVASNSFSAKSIFVKEGTEGNTEKIIARSREKYSRPREEIEEQIKKWSNVDSLDVDKAVDRQKESKFDGNDYVKMTGNKFTGRQSEKREQGSRYEKKEPYRKTASQPPREEHSRTVRDAIKEQLQNTKTDDSAKKETPSVTTHSVPKEVTVAATTHPHSTTTEKGNKITDTVLPATQTKKEVEETVSPEKLKEIIRKVTSPTTQTSSHTTPSKVMPNKSQEADSHETIENSQSHIIQLPTHTIKKREGSDRLEENTENKKKTTPENKKTGDIEGNHKDTIKVTRFKGGATVERIKEEEVKKTQAPTPSVAKNSFKADIDKDDDNIKKITKEEFLELKEIGPNEKILIVDKPPKTNEPRKEQEGIARSINKTNTHKVLPSHTEIKPGDTINFKKSK